tara:strand:- start:295 stop:561 length:267 start_codon:yes stop_codon:yes gene_type:complete
MKPIQQVFALVLEKIYESKEDMGSSIRTWKKKLKNLHKEYINDSDKLKKKIEDLRNKEVKKLLFDKYLITTDNMKKNDQGIRSFYNTR